jgi:hypothetical protein
LNLPRCDFFLKLTLPKMFIIVIFCVHEHLDTNIKCTVIYVFQIIWQHSEGYDSPWAQLDMSVWLELTAIGCITALSTSPPIMSKHLQRHYPICRQCKFIAWYYGLQNKFRLYTPFIPCRKFCGLMYKAFMSMLLFSEIQHKQ